MLVKQKHVKKEDVTYVTASNTAQEALQKLNESGFRCIPVLDDTETKFVGNVYKVTLLEYFVEHGNLDVGVEQLCQDRDSFIFEESSFRNILLNQNATLLSCVR